MLDYEWGNPSTIMLTGNDEAAAAAQDSEQTHRQIFEHYNSPPFLPDHLISQAPQGPTPTTTSDFSLVHHHQQFQSQPRHHHILHHHQQQQHSLFDTRAFSIGSSSHFPPPPPPPSAQPPHSMFSLDPLPPVNAGSGLLMVPKSDDVGRPMDFSASRIGLNLGGRTYFSSSEDDFVNRLYRRPRPFETGSTVLFSNNSPRCQAEGCNADLSHAKHYHRRHKVCEFHSKAATVIAAGLTQRFCQQCSRWLPWRIDENAPRFHLLSEFDNGKRSCRKRLADHNRRRRKTQQPPHQEIQKSHLQKPRNSTLDIAAKGSSPDSGIRTSSSVSPPDYFQQNPYHQNTSTSGTLFFSSG